MRFGTKITNHVKKEKRNIMKKRLNKKGFSLVELIVCIAILAVLISIIAPTLVNNIEKSRESKDLQKLDTIAAAMQYALADEAANEEIEALVPAYIKLEDMGAGASVITSNSTFNKLVREYLKEDSDLTKQIKFKFESKNAKNAAVYFIINNGKVTVLLADSSVTPTSEDNAVKGSKSHKPFVITR